MTVFPELLEPFSLAFDVEFRAHYGKGARGKRIIVGSEFMAHDLKARDRVLGCPFGDVEGEGERLEQFRKYCRRHKIPFFAISAATREGLDECIRYMGQQVEMLRKTPCETNS